MIYTPNPLTNNARTEKENWPVAGAEKERDESECVDKWDDGMPGSANKR